MRNASALIVVALAAAAMPAAAALAPQYQRLAELKAVLADPGIGAAFGIDAPIERIEYVKPDLYRVSGGGCRLDVAIVGLPMPRGIAGPRRFSVRAGTKACGR